MFTLARGYARRIACRTLGRSSPPHTRPRRPARRGGTRHRARGVQGAREHQPGVRPRGEEGAAPTAARPQGQRDRGRPGGPLRQQDLPRAAARGRLPGPARPQAELPLPRAAAGREPQALVLPAQEAQAGPQLREGARRRRAGDDRPPARGQEAQRRSVPDPDRVLGLPGGGPARPARDVDLPAAANDPLAPGDLDRRRLADRPAARTSPSSASRCAARVAPAAPSTCSTTRRPTTATTRSRPSPPRSWVKGGKVGMAGISFSGITQLFTAGTRPPHLAAVAPMSVTDDLYTATGYPGGIFNSGFAQSWVVERMDDAKPAPAGGQPWAQGARQAGRQALPRQPEAAPPDSERAQDPARESVPHAVAVRTPLAGRVAEARPRPDLPRRPVPGRADGRPFRGEPQVPERPARRVHLAPERRARRLARADDDHALGRVPEAVRGERDPGRTRTRCCR